MLFNKLIKTSALLVVIGLLGLVSASSHAALTITDVTYVNDASAFDANPEPDGQELVTFRIGSTDYTAVGATPTNISSGGQTVVAATNDSPVSKTQALTGLSVTDAVLNLEQVDFNLGITVSDDATPLFFGELGITSQGGSSDSVTLHPLISGVVDTSYRIDITGASYSYNNNVQDEWSTDENTNNLHTELAGFVLSDFKNLSNSSPTSITGFRVLDDVGSVSADIVLGGHGVAIPEPGSVGLLLIGTVLMLLRRRR